MMPADETVFWNRWKEHHQQLGLGTKLIEDGIINPSSYNEAKSKILFVLKDWNLGDDTTTNLRPYCEENPWGVLGTWAYGIQNDFPPIEMIGVKEREQAFRSTALMNLKKIGGLGSVDDDVIGAYASLDRDLLVQQMEDINPEIILAGGTFKWLVWLLDLPVNPDHLQESVTWRGRRVINMEHPSSRKSHEAKYLKLRSCLIANEVSVV